ncbi:Rv0361 family membrane protein [Mycolicibacterium thermoresistibile]
MTNYPPVPPQPPYGPGAPPPQQPPYGYGGPPPQQPPYGYGNPPPGYGAAPAGGYGGPPPGGPFPPPGYGYPPPYGGPPPSKGPGKWLLIGGLAVVAVIALVVVIAVSSGSGGGGPSTTADRGTTAGVDSEEAAIRQMLESLSEDTSADTATVMREYFCAGDRELLESFGNLDGLDLPSGTSGPTPDAPEISDIQVTGDKATARATIRGLQSTMHFRKESGKWKFCMTDSPEYANLPTFPR